MGVVVLALELPLYTDVTVGGHMDNTPPPYGGALNPFVLVSFAGMVLAVLLDPATLER